MGNDTSLNAEILDFVASAARSLRSRNNPEAVARQAARIPVPVLADLTLVYLHRGDAAGILEIGHESAAERARIRALIEARSESLLPQLARIGGAADGRPRWIPTVTPESLAEAGASDPDVAALAKASGVTSLLINPLTAHGQPLGVLVLARTRPDQPYDAADFAAGLMLARRTALAVDELSVRTGTRVAEPRRARIEEALGKWSHTFEAATWAAAILDASDWRIEIANSAFALLHGFAAADELIARPLLDFVAPVQRAELLRLIAEAPEEPISIETMHVRRNGTPFPVLLKITAPRESGGASYRAAHVQDLSELRRTEERLRSAQRMEAVGRLAGGVAHEVNNMMTIVLGFSEFLLRDPGMSQTNREDVEEIQRAADRAAGITRQLLAYSRQQVLHTSVLDLSEVVGEASQYLRALLPTNIQFQTRLESVGAWVRADRTQLEQVLINLAFNARDAMPEGGTLLLETRIERLSSAALQRRIGIPIAEGDYASASVRDTGFGMDQETLEHLFEPFYTTKSTGEGTGLGLSTVYGIIKQSGGYITAASKPGKGSTFSIYLPLVRAPTGDGEPDPETMSVRGTEMVLIVEDEDAVRTMAARALRDQGYTTLEAANGVEALDLLQARGKVVDLIVSDLVMPELGGRALRERLGELGLSIPVLSISAYSREEAQARGMIGREDAFVPKPFTPALLVGEVRALLDANRPSVVAR